MGLLLCCCCSVLAYYLGYKIYQNYDRNVVQPHGSPYSPRDNAENSRVSEEQAEEFDMSQQFEI